MVSSGGRGVATDPKKTSKLSGVLTHAPVLSFPDFTRPFVLGTNASNSGIGAVLSQIINGQETVIAYASWTRSQMV